MNLFVLTSMLLARSTYPASMQLVPMLVDTTINFLTFQFQKMSATMKGKQVIYDFVELKFLEVKHFLGPLVDRRLILPMFHSMKMEREIVWHYLYTVYNIPVESTVKGTVDVEVTVT